MNSLNEFPICFPSCGGELSSFAFFDSFTEFLDSVSEETEYLVKFWDTPEDAVAEGVLTQMAQDGKLKFEENKSGWFNALPPQIQEVVLATLDRESTTEVVDVYLQLRKSVREIGHECWGFKEVVGQEDLVALNSALVGVSDFTGQIFGTEDVVVSGGQLRTLAGSKLAFGIRSVRVVGSETTSVAPNLHLAIEENASYVSDKRGVIATSALVGEAELPQLPVNSILNYSLWQEFVSCVVATNHLTEVDTKQIYLAQLMMALTTEERLVPFSSLLELIDKVKSKGVIR